jgi:hypothetical protein
VDGLLNNGYSFSVVNGNAELERKEKESPCRMVGGFFLSPYTIGRGKNGKEEMDELIDPKNVMFIGDYFSLIVGVAIRESDLQDGEAYEDGCVRAASTLMKQHYGWDVEKFSNHVGVLDEGDPNCETCYGAGKVQSEVGGVERELECPDCFNNK